MSKKTLLTILIILLAAVFVSVLIVQDFTSFKIFDYVKSFLGKIKVPNFGASSPTPIPGKQLNIFIRDVGFVPNNSGLEAGGKVTWYNEDTRSHIIAGETWVSAELKPGQTFSKIFDAPGVYNYHCAVYPDLSGQFTVY